jgi:hypothetical protein
MHKLSKLAQVSVFCESAVFVVRVEAAESDEVLSPVRGSKK